MVEPREALVIPGAGIEAVERRARLEADGETIPAEHGAPRLISVTVAARTPIEGPGSRPLNGAP